MMRYLKEKIKKCIEEIGALESLISDIFENFDLVKKEKSQKDEENENWECDLKDRWKFMKIVQKKGNDENGDPIWECKMSKKSVCPNEEKQGSKWAKYDELGSDSNTTSFKKAYTERLKSNSERGARSRGNSLKETRTIGEGIKITRFMCDASEKKEEKELSVDFARPSNSEKVFL